MMATPTAGRLPVAVTSASRRRHASSSRSRPRAATNDGGNKPSWERDNAKNVPIWEINIDAEFDRIERAKADAERAAQAKASSGLGFARARMLDDMSLDLSATLKRKEDEDEDEDARRRNPKALPSGQQAALLSASAKADELKFVDKRGKMIGEPSALDLATTKKGESKYNLNGWNYAPTRAEKGRWQREWEKAERAKAMKTPGYRPASSTSIKSKIKDATFMPQKAFADLTDEEKARRRAEDEAKYKKIKEDLLLTTAGMAGSGAVAAFAVGGYNMGFSWLLGAAGAIVYVRLLSGKAESEGGGQGGPPSILVPVILFMALNRYNFFFSEDLGVTLTPIPMLLAFFTYKPASILQAFKDVLGADEDESQTA